VPASDVDAYLTSQQSKRFSVAPSFPAGHLCSVPSDPVAMRVAGVIARQIKEMAPRVGVGYGISLKDDSGGGGAGGHITRKMAMENQSNV